MSRKWPISEGTLWSQRKPNDCQQAFKSWGKGMEWISHLQDHGPEDMLILNSQAPEMLDNTFLCWSYLVCNSYYSNLNALSGAMYSEAQCDPTLPCRSQCACGPCCLGSLMSVSVGCDSGSCSLRDPTAAFFPGGWSPWLMLWLIQKQDYHSSWYASESE